MHSKGVCHLDLKPENVMVSGHGDGPVVKIIDFGMADCAGEAMFKSVGGNAATARPSSLRPATAVIPGRMCGAWGR